MNDSRKSALSKKVLLPLAIVAAAALTAALVLANRRQPERRVEEPTAPLVRVVTAHRSSTPMTVRSYGSVEPAVETTLVAEVAGRLASVSEALRPGGGFRAGQVVARIDDADYRLAAEQAEATRARALVQLELETAEAAVARDEWAELGVGDASLLTTREPQLAMARADLRAAEAAVERARLDLERTAIRAPFDGRTRSLLADVGRWVAKGTALAEIFSVDGPELVLPVGRHELEFLDLETVAAGAGPRVRLSAEIAGVTGVWAGRIVRTGGEIDPSTRMLPLHARVDDRRSPPPAPPLPMGLFVEAEIEGVTAVDVFLLPRAALRNEDRVLVVDGEDRLRYRDVEVLRTEPDRVVVAAGLDDGERVCVSPLETVVDGMQVRILAEVPADGLAATPEAGS